MPTETTEVTATATTANGTATYDFPYRFRLYDGDDAAHSVAVAIRRLDRETTPVETAVDFDGEIESKETIDFSDELGGDDYRVDIAIEGGVEETTYLFDYSYGEATIVGPDELGYEIAEY